MDDMGFMQELGVEQDMRTKVNIYNLDIAVSMCL